MSCYIEQRVMRMRTLRYEPPMAVVVAAVAAVAAAGVLVWIRGIPPTVPAFAFGLIIFGSLLALVLWWLRLVIEVASVSRERLERFARRHDLEVTVSNGEQVIRYLATTRRWRSAGLAVSLVAAIATGVLGGTYRFDFLTFFAGWFVGALIAEARIDHLAYGRRRAASLVPRRPTAYLPPFFWWLVPIAGGFAAAAVLACATLAQRGWPVAPGRAIGWTLAAAAVTVAVRRMQLHVLRRPQPVAAPDVLAADDAIRSRSLHVLASGGATLIVYCAAGLLATMSAALGGNPELDALGQLVVFVMPLYGWSVAIRRWRAGPEAPG
jgi:hypothetical protein